MLALCLTRTVTHTPVMATHRASSWPPNIAPSIRLTSWGGADADSSTAPSLSSEGSRVDGAAVDMSEERSSRGTALGLWLAAAVAECSDDDGERSLLEVIIHTGPAAIPSAETNAVGNGDTVSVDTAFF